MSCFLRLIQLQLILWLTVSVSASASSNTTHPPIAMPNCKDDCGGVKIPYPFGIGPDCFYGSFYEIFCDHSFRPRPKPFLKHYNLEVTRINWQDNDGNHQTLTVRSRPANICESESVLLLGVDLEGSPFRFSILLNDFVVEGCSGNVVVRDRSGQIVSGCTSLCANSDATINLTACHGVGCCRTTLFSPLVQTYMPDEYYDRVEATTRAYNYVKNDSGIYRIGDDQDNSYFPALIGSDIYEIGLDSTTPIRPATTCTLTAALVDYKEKITAKLSDSSTVPTVLLWHVDSSYLKNKKKHHVFCDDSVDDEGIQKCGCRPYYEGNPYLPNGCQRTEEEPVEKGCEDCRHNCAYNSTSNHYYCKRKSWLKKPLFLGFSTAMGLVLVLLSCYWLYRFIKWRIEIQRKAKNFKRNGGLLLQQQMSSSDGVIDKMTIFAVSELEKATDNFHANRVLGQGGQGTVYKGMLMDGRIVAIKKSTEVEKDQLDQFINEVVILSHINHRNVVKLLGCCLETEVPLLVYEFIQNGTLYQHIHEPTEDFHVAWKMRLQIAAESAGAVAYLHSSSSAPIYHRDIKSSNILLDEKYRAKVSDFGTSRAINIEETHVTTRVQGTYGYLDPEYFQSNQFTEKSDVYSFGVVLVELITGKKPIRLTESGGWKSLATEFLSQMESSSLFDIVDTRIIEEGKAEQFIAVADLARQCLSMNGKQRPTMKEVGMVLDRIKSPNLKEQITDNGKCMVTEINDSGPRSTDMFFSANGSFSSMPIEAQPLMFNTQ